jgi:hypothetical protein
MLELESFDHALRAMQAPFLWAYLDPGTGSMLLQVLIAGLLSTSFFVKSWVRQLRGSLLLLKSRKT